MSSLGGEMKNTKYIVLILMLALVVSLTAFVSNGCASTGPGTGQKVTVHLGGTFALTGAYAEDCAAVLAGFQDYAQYVNDTQQIAPWYSDRKIPTGVTFDVLWRDDQLAADKTIAAYEELKSKGLMVERISGSTEGLAIKDRLIADKIMATSQSTGPYLLQPPGNIVTNYPIYTDACAAIADWFKTQWKGSAKPRVAYLTADNPMGQQVVTPEMDAYLKNAGFDLVGTQSVPLAPTTAPTTQLTWLKDNKVDLTIGVMINPGSQPTIKEAVRLGMGADLPYKIVFGFATPSHFQVFLPAMGELGNGVCFGGCYAPWDDPGQGMKFINDIQNKYRPTKKVTHIMYVCGVVEAMTQVESIRLACQTVAPEKLTSADILNGTWKIKDLSTGDLTATPLNYAQGQPQGINKIAVHQIQKGKAVKVGTYPLGNIYKK
jgi:ABC-type branched-subunit amino acid transport system substrate-binding protein